VAVPLFHSGSLPARRAANRPLKFRHAFLVSIGTPREPGTKEAVMSVIIVAIGGCVGLALLGRAVATTTQRMRSWYRGSVAGSALELVVLAALVGGVLGELYRRMRP
jgi:hypothetical protein